MKKDESGQFGNDIGNGCMALGCMITLIPVAVLLIVLLVAFVGAVLGVGE